MNISHPGRLPTLQELVETEVRLQTELPLQNEREILWERVRAAILAAQANGTLVSNGKDMQAAQKYMDTMIAQVRGEHPGYAQGKEQGNGKEKLQVGNTYPANVTRVAVGKYVLLSVPHAGRVFVPWQDHGNVHVKPGGSVTVEITRGPQGGEDPSHGGRLVAAAQ